MNTIFGDSVDLISPFPDSQARRVFGWMFCNSSISMIDTTPREIDAFASWLAESAHNPAVLSWGIIDKNNKLGLPHDAPLVGIVMFELASPFNGYFHVASTRRAWGKGFVDEAAALVIKHIFDTLPSLARVSAFVLDSNSPAKALALRVGFKREALLQDMVRQNNEPKAIVHFGLTRRAWECQSQPPSPSLLHSVEQGSQPLLDEVSQLPLPPNSNLPADLPQKISTD